jgi:hypothetical protein
MPQNRNPLKSCRYSPQGKRTTGRPKKRWRGQLEPWRRNGPNGPTLDVYDDYDDYDDDGDDGDDDVLGHVSSDVFIVVGHITVHNGTSTSKFRVHC